ncbi:aminopeptidase P family protein [Candidatus Curtissbacteria bacterium]|nr:aminopeptidase P family protein [Candidatus Curtissbacteria bacterium]
MTDLPKGITAFIVTNPVNIFYLTSFKGVSPIERESILVLTPQKHLIAPRLYQAEAKSLETKDLEVHVAQERDQMFKIIKKLLAGKKRVGFEQDNLKYSEYQELKKLLTRSLLVPYENFIENLRIKKTAEEIKNIERAQIISQKAFGQLLKTIKTVQTETEIAEKLEKIIKSLGGQGLSFETIVAVGRNSAKPHHLTGNKKLETGNTLLVDFGAKHNNYCADITRTIFIGKPKDEQINIYKLVEKAQKKAIDAITHGFSAQKAHDTAHSVFEAAKLHDNFLHGLGHGIGLEVHEAPHLRASSYHVLEENMVFSIEPGLYFPSWGGVRIEDLVVIKNGRAKMLGKLQEEIIVL